MYNLKTNYNLSKNSWFGIGGKADKFFAPNDENELLDYIKKNSNEKCIVIGSGSNILFRDKGCKETIVKLGKNFRNISIKDNQIICGSGVLKNQLSKFALDNGFVNFEFLSCIPGTIGGGVTMNAGCFQNEFKDIVDAVRGISKKNLKFVNYNKKEIKFTYRKIALPEDLIITEVIFKINHGSKEKIKDKIEYFKKKKRNSTTIKNKNWGKYI